MNLYKLNMDQTRPQVEKNGQAVKLPLSEADKIKAIKKAFQDIMEALGLDMDDDSLKDTPERVAKMFVQESFKGLDKKNFPEMNFFENKFNYHQLLIEKNITVNSYCEHHFVPIIGKAHVGYIPKEKIIGLSKINRLVDFFARKPQVQEKLTMEIAESLMKLLDTADIAIVIEAQHLCVCSRGINDTNSLTETSYFGGVFQNVEKQNIFLSSVVAKK